MKMLLLLACIGIVHGTPLYVSPLTDIPESVYSTAIVKMEAPLATERSLSFYLGYVDLLLAGYPSAECAEYTLEQSEHSHATTVSEIENAISSPSTITNPTYISELENEYPSIVSAYTKIFSVETSHPQFAYIQTILTSVEVTDSTIMTDISIINEVESPTTDQDESIVYSAVEASPSLDLYLRTISELTGRFPSLSSAEVLINYYERESPSVVQTLFNDVFSPSVVKSPLPAEFPTLAVDIETLVSYDTEVTDDAQHLIEEYFVNSATVPSVDISYIKKIISDYPKVASAEKVVAYYDIKTPTLVVQVDTEVQSPQVLHMPDIVSNPELAYAYVEVDHYKAIIPSVVATISKLVQTPKEIQQSSEEQAKAEANAYQKLVSAYQEIAKAKKSDAAIVQKVSKEVSASSIQKIQKEVAQHSALISAFDVVSRVAKQYQGLKQAQESVDCAESQHASLFSAYKRVSQQRNSFAQYVHHGAVVQKSVHSCHHN